MNPLFIHKQHIYLECATTLNDTEDLHPLYNNITQMSLLNVQGYENTAGASACRGVMQVSAWIWCAEQVPIRKATRQFALKKY